MTNKMANHERTCIVLVKHIHSNQGKILALFLKLNKCLLIYFSYAVKYIFRYVDTDEYLVD